MPSIMPDWQAVPNIKDRSNDGAPRFVRLELTSLNAAYDPRLRKITAAGAPLRVKGVGSRRGNLAARARANLKGRQHKRSNLETWLCVDDEKENNYFE